MTFWNGHAWLPETPKTPTRNGRTRARDRLATLIMVVFVGLYLVPFADTTASGPTLTLSPTGGAPGTKVTVTGQGFTSKGQVALTWDGASAGLPTVLINGRGGWRASFKVPKDTIGPHTVGAALQVSAATTSAAPSPVTARFEITAATGPTPAPTATPTAAPKSTPAPTPTATPAPTPKPTPTPATPTPTPKPTSTTAPAATPTSTPSPTPTPTPASRDAAGFVTRCGTGLCLDGRGWYLYGASQLGGLDDPSGRASLAVSAGLNTLRVVNFLDEHGAPSSAPFAETRWQRVDRVIAAASQDGLHVILDLSTYRNLLWNAGANPYTTDWQSFLAFVAGRRNTASGVLYADDPTIAILAFAGEVEPINTPSNTRGITTAQVTGFFQRTFAEWKALDARHLTSTGGLLQLDWNSGIDWKTIFGLANDDVCSIHDYSSADETITTPAVSAYCASIGKPWITEEFGWDQATGDATRADLYSAMYGLQRTYHAAGVGNWNLGTQLGGTTFDVNTGTPLTWNAVTSHAP